MSLQGEDGFLITTPGACLTDEQIDDICLKSKEVWEKQAAARSQQNPDKPLKRPLHQPVLISQGDWRGIATAG
ncbi:Uu.00g097350.m01.CDS01 [Anthostomella pinea]|uniref:Uu.00g097350.m01.CDS01 n=1 Tax=Anthostomella pinea TaxID=933095 RepID=A0AAI8VCG9_9PEZI|nr:Uu.00g097350.m01.CDS01 [Anthostomella pinea]